MIALLSTWKNTMFSSIRQLRDAILSLIVDMRESRERCSFIALRDELRDILIRDIDPFLLKIVQTSEKNEATLILSSDIVFAGIEYSADSQYLVIGIRTESPRLPDLLGYWSTGIESHGELLRMHTHRMCLDMSTKVHTSHFTDDSPDALRMFHSNNPHIETWKIRIDALSV